MPFLQKIRFVLTAACLCWAMPLSLSAADDKPEAAKAPVPAIKLEADAILAHTHGPAAKDAPLRNYQPPPLPPLQNPRLTPDRGVGRMMYFRREKLTSKVQ